MIVVGFDVSTFQIDWAWRDNGIPKRERLELGKGNAITRIQRIRGITLPAGTEEACIEMPWGVNVDTTRKLSAVMGAITCRIPDDVRVSWIDPGDLRRALGLSTNKEKAQAAYVREVDPVLAWLRHWDADALDALITAEGWTKILEAQDA